MDQDQSGTITVMELYKFLIKVSKLDNPDSDEVPWNDVRSIFKNLDKDGDRNVEWEEFFVSTT